MDEEEKARRRCCSRRRKRALRALWCVARAGRVVRVTLGADFKVFKSSQRGCFPFVKSDASVDGDWHLPVEELAQREWKAEGVRVER